MQKLSRVLLLICAPFSTKVLAHDFSCQVNQVTDLFTQKPIVGPKQSFTVNTHSGQMVGDIQTSNNHQPVVVEKAKNGTLKILDIMPTLSATTNTHKTAPSQSTQAGDIKYLSIATQTKDSTKPFFYIDNNVSYSGVCRLATHN